MLKQNNIENANDNSLNTEVAFKKFLQQNFFKEEFLIAKDLPIWLRFPTPYGIFDNKYNTVQQNFENVIKGSFEITNKATFNIKEVSLVKWQENLHLARKVINNYDIIRLLILFNHKILNNDNYNRELDLALENAIEAINDDNFIITDNALIDACNIKYQAIEKIIDDSFFEIKQGNKVKSENIKSLNDIAQEINDLYFDSQKINRNQDFSKTGIHFSINSYLIYLGFRKEITSMTEKLKQINANEDLELQKETLLANVKIAMISAVKIAELHNKSVEQDFKIFWKYCEKAKEKFNNSLVPLGYSQQQFDEAIKPIVDKYILCKIKVELSKNLDKKNYQIFHKFIPGIYDVFIDKQINAEQKVDKINNEINLTMKCNKMSFVQKESYLKMVNSATAIMTQEQNVLQKFINNDITLELFENVQSKLKLAGHSL